MKKTLIASLSLAASLWSAHAQYFTNGNLAVVRIGGANQTVATTGGGNPVWVDQYTTNGALANSYALPTNGANAFTLNGLAYNGFLTLTPDGTHLVMGGFNSPAPYISNGVVQNVAFSFATNVPRAIATIDGYGNYAMPIINSNLYNTFVITGAVSDGSNFWAQGTGATPPGVGGIVYCGTALNPQTNQIVNGSLLLGTGSRSLNLYNNSLYALGYPSNSTANPQTGAWMLSNIGGALPTNTTSFNLAMPTGTGAAATPVDLVINPAGTIAYVADYSFGIVKFTNYGGGWVSNYTIIPTNTGYASASGSSHAIGVTADFTQTPPVVYATTGETLTNRLVMIQDNGIGSTVINLASNVFVTGAGGSTNTFRGVRFVPGSAPLITAQPTGVASSADGTATFTVASLGTSGLGYQWYTNGVAVSAATGSSLTFNNVTTFQNGTVVSVVITNAYGSVTSSNATLTVNPNFFVAGNLAVVSVGGPGQSVSASDTGNTVSILQFTTNVGQSAPVSTLALPSSGPNAFALDGSSTEGFMSYSANGQYLVLGGYNVAAPYSSGIAAASSTNVPRAVATIDGYGNYAMPIANTNVFSGANIRGAVFDGTNNFWVTGSGGSSNSFESAANFANSTGIIYVGTPGSSGVNVRVGITGTGNERCLNIFNNTIYVGTGSVTHGIWSITGPTSPPPPTGLPTNAPVNTIVQPSATGPYDFAFDPGFTTCYVADGNLAGIIKYTNNAGTWVSNYLISVGGTGSGVDAGGVTADFTQNPPVVYATTSEAVGNRLIRIVDTGAGATFSVIATATANSTGSNYFRGVRFVPGVLPAITSQPAPFVQDAGGNATFTVGASGTPTLNYQWYTNGVAVAGATTTNLTLSSVTTAQNGFQVSVVVSNNFGAATSSNALLSVQPPGAPLNVTITSPNQIVNAGSAAVINASAVGTTLTYYWTLNGAPLTDGGSVSGSSTSALTISPAYATFNGTYTVTASNSFGKVAANNSVTLKVIDPVITVQPVGSTNLPNTSASLSVTAFGAPALTYQWLSNGVAIAGATTSSLNFANSGAVTSGSFSVIVSNNLGSSITSTVTVVSFTPFLLNDTFSYANGNLFGDAGSPWTDINGSNPELVINGRVQVAQTNATTDAQSLYTIPVSNTVVWASFIINLSTLPTNAGGTYFANLEDNNFGFYGRLFTLTTNTASFTPGIPSAAFPGTYRLGIANGQNDSTGTAATGPTAVVPMDLAPGIDYRVVFFVDLNNLYSSMAINPASISDLMALKPAGVSSGPAGDTITPKLPLAAFGLRQRQGEGIMQLDNLEVSFDYSGAGSGYGVVTGGVSAANPVIGLQPLGTTNFVATSYQMEVAASGIGTAGVGLTYAWYQNGVALTDGGSVTGSATPTLVLNSLVATNSGTYYVLVKGATGTNVQSSNAIVLVNTTPTAPVFTVQPATNTIAQQGASVTLSALAVGTGPITYEWFFNGSDTGSSGTNLTLTGLTTNQAGTYTVVATGATAPAATSSNAVLVVNGPKSVTIGYLRSLLNPVTYAPSDTTTFYSVTGVITTATNQTSGNTGSYYLQDATGGINLFVTFGSDFRPQLADVVTATGVLSTFADNFELDVSEGTAPYVDTIVSHNGALPTPILLPWGNNVAPLSPSLSTNVEGSVVVITNLYFAAYNSTNVFVAGTDYIVTNNAGSSYTIFVSDEDTNYVTGQKIPQFATSLAGPLIQDNTVIGISFTVWSNLVVGTVQTLPPAVTVHGMTAGTGGTNFTLTWLAVPTTATYSVWTTTNVTQPFKPLVSGLSFSTTNGNYTDVSATNMAKFYQIISP